MNKVVIIFLSLICCANMNAQNRKTVTSKLKTITVTEQKFDKGVAGKSMPEAITRYDSTGNMVEEISYKQGKINEHFTYKYDAANNKIQETEFDGSGKKIKVTKYTYSKNLRTEKTVYDGNNQLLSKKTYKYEVY